MICFQKILSRWEWTAHSGDQIKGKDRKNSFQVTKIICFQKKKMKNVRKISAASSSTFVAERFIQRPCRCQLVEIVFLAAQITIRCIFYTLHRCNQYEVKMQPIRSSIASLFAKKKNSNNNATQTNDEQWLIFWWVAKREFAHFICYRAFSRVVQHRHFYAEQSFNTTSKAATAAPKQVTL